MGSVALFAHRVRPLQKRPPFLTSLKSYLIALFDDLKANIVHWADYDAFDIQIWSLGQR